VPKGLQFYKDGRVKNVAKHLKRTYETTNFDRQLAKLRRTQSRVTVAQQERLKEPFPKKNRGGQFAWVIRQLDTIKEIYLAEMNEPRQFKMSALEAYKKTVLDIRATMEQRDKKYVVKVPKPKKPETILAELLTAETEEQIQKAREARNGGHRRSDPETEGEESIDREGAGADRSGHGGAGEAVKH
jgi:hypothetical protein